MRTIKSMLRLIKRRLHLWRFCYRRGGIGWFFLPKRWEAVCRRYRYHKTKIKWGWASPEYRRDRLFEMFHGMMPMDFYFNEGPVISDPIIHWWHDPDTDEPDDYEQWWEDYMPGRLIYYYVLLCCRLGIPTIDTEIRERSERAERHTEEHNERQNMGRMIFDMMMEESGKDGQLQDLSSL